MSISSTSDFQPAKVSNYTAIGEIRKWQEELLRGILRSVLLVAPIVVIVAIIDTISLGIYWTIPFYIGSYLFVALAFILKDSPYKLRAWSVVALLYMMGVVDFLQDGYQSSARVFLLAVPFVTGILFGRKQSYISLLVAFITFIGFGFLFSVGILEIPGNPHVAEIGSWVVGAVTMTLIGVMMVVSLNYLMARMISSLDQSRKLLGELEFERKDLEIRVSERTRALETSTEVSRRLSTILDQQELVNAIVEEVQGAFGYYHVHIYLYDACEEHLLMVGGTGEAGRVMLGRGHSIPKGLGLVGRAAEQNKLVLVPDTSMDADWLPNPLLPETMAEIAVPIASGERVLGVLDVQHDVVNGLGQDDATLLSSIANQVAVAVQNAQLYAQAQWKADRETLLNQINQHIQAAGTVEDVLIIAARELSQALEAERAVIQLGGISSNGGAARYLEGIVS